MTEREDGPIPVSRARVLVFASLPPPYHGTTVMNAVLLRSRLAEGFELVHVDLSDHRDVSNIGRIDFTNVRIALASIWRGFRAAWRLRPDLIFLSVSEYLLPFLRDSAYVLVTRPFCRRILLQLHGGDFGGFYRRSAFLTQIGRASCRERV